MVIRDTTRTVAITATVPAITAAFPEEGAFVGSPTVLLVTGSAGADGEVRVVVLVGSEVDICALEATVGCGGSAVELTVGDCTVVVSVDNMGRKVLCGG